MSTEYAAKLAELHQRIMNIPVNDPIYAAPGTLSVYHHGHRDARHAAAELVSAELGPLLEQVQRLTALYAQCRVANEQYFVANERLTALYAPFKPMTAEEAEAAFDAIEAAPMQADEIEDAVKYATDPEHRERSLRKRGDELSRICRGQRAEIERLTAENAGLLAELKVLRAFADGGFDAAIDAARKGG